MTWALVTGSNGGIGSAISRRIAASNIRIIGMDRDPDRNGLDAFIEFDLTRLISDGDARDEFESKLNDIVGDERLVALINNAATQIPESFEDLTYGGLTSTLNTNLHAPIVLSHIVYGRLVTACGNLVNIGSIHSDLTKPKFVAYATSKAGLAGFTKALAVDSQGKVRVNMIQPAAIATEMLEAGFADDQQGLAMLKSFHPSGRIGAPEEIAELVSFIISDKCSFLNGAVIDVSGGIRSKLHDPA